MFVTINIISMKKTPDIYNGENIFEGFSVDCVILTFYKGRIRVLLRDSNIENYWALLGGFMFNEEDADQSAYRTLETYTNLKKHKDIYLRQFQLFSNPDRSVMVQNIIKANTGYDWLLKRFITMGYFALVKYEQVIIPPKAKLKWFDIKQLPPLYADHKKIIDAAIESVRSMLPVIPIGHTLLTDKFTMTELRQIYEIILDTTFDRRNFQRKVLSEGNVIQLDEKKGKGKYNSPALFTFNKEKLASIKNNEPGLIL